MEIFKVIQVCLVMFVVLDQNNAENSKQNIKRDPLDFTENDVNKLYDQWEENDADVLPEDEREDYHLKYPGGKHRQPMLKPEDLTGTNPEKLMKMAKKGHTLMMFATVSGNPTRRETDEITQIWWGGLKNALYDVTKYVVDDNRILFLLQDGSQAYEVKDFLIKQDRCEEVTIDNRPYYGKGSPKYKSGNRKDL